MRVDQLAAVQQRRGDPWPEGSALEGGVSEGSASKGGALEERKGGTRGGGAAGPAGDAAPRARADRPRPAPSRDSSPDSSPDASPLPLRPSLPGTEPPLRSRPSRATAAAGAVLSAHASRSCWKTHATPPSRARPTGGCLRGGDVARGRRPRARPEQGARGGAGRAAGAQQAARAATAEHGREAPTAQCVVGDGARRACSATTARSQWRGSPSPRSRQSLISSIAVDEHLFCLLFRRQNSQRHIRRHTKDRRHCGAHSTRKGRQIVVLESSSLREVEERLLLCHRELGDDDAVGWSWRRRRVRRRRAQLDHDAVHEALHELGRL